MTTTLAFQIDCLVAYKKQPARVLQVGERLQIQLGSGEILRVRSKDVILIHPGPLTSLAGKNFSSTQAGESELETAWDLLRSSGASCTLAELAELVHGEYTPASAWGAWLALEDGLYFSGTPDAIAACSPGDVARQRQERQARLAQAEAQADFLQRLRSGEIDLIADRSRLREIEDLAWGRRTTSGLLRQLGHAERPQVAHTLLLEWGVWDETANPHPVRINTPLSPPESSLPDLPDETRLDLTHLPAFAIDDQGNQDPDDALSIDGERLWVHVADPAALVAPDSPADQEARSRAVTLYLPEGTVPMLLPAAVQRLGLGLQEISPALSFGIHINPSGEIALLEIVPSWVKVQRLTYEQAEALLAEGPLASLERLAILSHKRRLAGSAAEIELPEASVRLVGGPTGQISIRRLPALRSREIVKETMLVAGEAAARFACQSQLPMPYTTQEPPEAQMLADIQARFGMPPPIQDSLLAEYNSLGRAYALRRAQKRSLLSVHPAPHAGLGLPLYTRVTSPLRRYSDLLAHQQLRAFILGQPVLSEAQLIERLGEAEPAAASAAQAENLSRRHWTLVYLRRQPGWSGSGVLIDQRGMRGRFILPDLALETDVHLRHDLPLDSQVSLTLKKIDLPELDAHFSLSTPDPAAGGPPV